MHSLKYIAAGAVLMCSVAANASINIASVNPGTSPYSGPTAGSAVYDYDSPGGTPTIVSGGAVVTGTAGSHAQPYGSTGNYYSVGPSDTTPGIIDLTGFGDINWMSILWGSVDSYNTLSFLDASMNVIQSFSGNDIFNPANGNQTSPNTNPWVLFSLNGGDQSAFSYLKFTSNTNAFETDNLVINPVPEPATWALMLFGFAGVGFAMRRAKAKVRLPQIA